MENYKIKSEYLKRLLDEIKERVHLMEIYFYSREEAEKDEIKGRMKVINFNLSEKGD